MLPLVTAIIPVYNGELYLKEAIDSLFTQTYPHLEIVVINDGSQDQTEQVIQKYGDRIRSFSQTNQGQSAAMNAGISMAKGRYIAFLDADDFHAPNKIDWQVKVLEDQPHVDMVFGLVKQFLSPEIFDQLQKEVVCPADLLPGYAAGAGLFRRQCFEKAGLFFEERKIGNFIDWYMRAQELQLKHILVNRLALYRRIHENNMGRIANDNRLGYLQIIKQALVRRKLI